MNLSPAVESILTTYDSEMLSDIANHGCASGCASSHITYTQTNDFFHEYETEIEDYLHDVFGDEYLENFANNSVRQMINSLTWCFIEMVAQDYINSMTDEEVYSEVA